MDNPKKKEDEAKDVKKTPKKKEDEAKDVKKTPKKKAMVVAKKVTVTNPYTKDVFLKGEPREMPRTKDSWYKSQVEGGYLTEVEV